MPRPLQRWPEYALDTLEDDVCAWKEVRAWAKAIQYAAIEKHYYTIIMLASDIQVKAVEQGCELHKARYGTYDRDEVNP